MLFSKNSKLARIHYRLFDSKIVSRFEQKNFFNVHNIYFFNATAS